MRRARAGVAVFAWFSTALGKGLWEPRRLAWLLHRCWLTVLLFGASAVCAESQPQSAPPIPGLAELAAPPILTRPALSASGRLVAALSYDGDVPVLVVLGLEPGQEPWLVTMEGWRVEWFRWLGDERILLGAISVGRSGRATGFRSRLMLVDPAQRKLKLMLRGHKEAAAVGFEHTLLATLPDDPKRVLVDLNPRYTGLAEARLLTLGKSRYIGRLVQAAVPEVSVMQADANGVVRAGWGIRARADRRVLKLRNGKGQWIDYSDRVQDDGFVVQALPTADLDTVYVVSDHEHDLGALYEFSVSQGTFGEMLAQSDASEIVGVSLSPDGTVLEAVYFGSEKVPDLFLNPWLARLYTKLDEILPGMTNTIVSSTPDRSRALIVSTSSTQAPQFWVFDRATMSLNPFAASYPSLVGQPLARTVSETYKARDGLSIQAYITRPVASAAGQQLPFVVLPHGGPHSRDFLRFDWLVQLLASQGFGVLQMNFRGSTGYGRKFEEAGQQQWGQAMQNDITDGTRWLIEQGYADVDRIAIAGGSYGGYAALMGVVREPELYRCAVSLNGVTDLPELLAEAYEYEGGRFLFRHIGRLWQDRVSLRSNSPAQQAARIQVPVLLAHGTEDLVVNVNQSRRMQQSLERAGATYRYLELPEGDHYLSRPSNRLAFSEALLRFLAEHLAAAPNGGES